MNKEEFETVLTSFFKTLPNEIRQSLRFNHAIDFNAGILAERINFVLNHTIGTPSNGGGAFDAANGSEAKCVFYAQPRLCNNCGSKVHYYAEKCRCGSTDLETKKDTRWGIDAKAHFKYLDTIPYYLFVAIKPLNKDLDNLQFNVEVFKINADDTIFNKILEQQLEKGTKHKNFMPYGRDFFMSSPTQILSVDVTINEDVSYDYINQIPTWLTVISTDLFTKAERKLLGNRLEVDTDEAYQIIGIGKSTHGKPRGETHRKIK